jgi:anti-anti-sigma regulatory factor
MAQGDSECWSIELDREAGAPRAARRSLVEWFPDLPVQVRESALVVVTELVTNAVRFGLPPIHVLADRDADVLVVEVCDDGDERPHRRVPAEDGGIGLNLVYLLADRVEIARDRSAVRCEFTSRTARGAPADPAEFDVELVREPASLRVVLRGDIDLTARDELDRVFAELERSRPERVLIDLRAVTFFDTTGLHMAHRFDRWGRDHDVPVVFTRGIPRVMLALRSAGLAIRLTFSDDA